METERFGQRLKERLLGAGQSSPPVPTLRFLPQAEKSRRAQNFQNQRVQRGKFRPESASSVPAPRRAGDPGAARRRAVAVQATARRVVCSAPPAARGERPSSREKMPFRLWLPTRRAGSFRRRRDRRDGRARSNRRGAGGPRRCRWSPRFDPCRLWNRSAARVKSGPPE